MGKKSRSNKKNKTKVARNRVEIAADHLPFTKDGEYYAKPLQERPRPDMTKETILQQYIPKLYECRSATAKRHQQVNELLLVLKASVLTPHSDSTSVSMSLQDLSRHEIFFNQSMILIQSISSTHGWTNGFSLSPLLDAIHDHGMITSQEIDSITESYPMSSMSNMQLADKLTVKDWVILLGNSMVLVFLQYRFGHAFKVVQELRAHAENGALTDLENQQLGSVTTTDLRSALSVTGIHAACILYQSRVVGNEQKPQAGSTMSATSKVPRSAFLLDAIEVLANDLVKYCPKSPVGYWWLGYVARESVAKRNWHGLKGAAVRLKHMTKCYEAADAQDDDIFMALGRIEAAMCHCLGGGGMVGYKVSNKKVMVRRDFGSDRLSTSKVNLKSTDKRLSSPKETRRIHSGIPTTRIETDETVLVPRWEVLRLWNEAMESYDALQKWGGHFHVFGEARGWSDVAEFLKDSRDCEPGIMSHAMKPLEGLGDWGFEAKRTSCFDLYSPEHFCTVCGKTDDMWAPLMKCSRCNEATYCSRDCQAKDWKNHKKVCNKN